MSGTGTRLGDTKSKWATEYKFHNLFFLREKHSYWRVLLMKWLRPVFVTFALLDHNFNSCQIDITIWKCVIFSVKYFLKTHSKIIPFAWPQSGWFWNNSWIIWSMDLTHWGRVTHICVGNLTIIGSDNGLSPGRRQAISWTNAGILLIGPLGTNFSEILIEIQTFSFKKIHLKMSPGKWRPFCLGLNVLIR